MLDGDAESVSQINPLLPNLVLVTALETNRATEPCHGLCHLYLAQAHLLLIEKIPLPLLGLISALITAPSRTFIIPRGQARCEQKGSGLCSSPIFWHSIKAQAPGRVPHHAAECDLGLARASGCISLFSPAEAPVASAASLIQLRVEVVLLQGPDAGLAPAAAALQGIKLLP